jgi:hypothetical protein
MLFENAYSKALLFLLFTYIICHSPIRKKDLIAFLMVIC